MNEVDYAALDAVHHAEDRVDDATGGRYYDAVEKADEEAGSSWSGSTSTASRARPTPRPLVNTTGGRHRRSSGPETRFATAAARP